MNEKITLPTLVQLLAIQSGETKKQSEDFIKELFGLISSALENGDNVRIKSLGVFKTVAVGARKSVNVATGLHQEIPSHYKVVFTPTKDVAASINEPFEMFESVELNPATQFEIDKDEKQEDDLRPDPEEVTVVLSEDPLTNRSTENQTEFEDESEKKDESESLTDDKPSYIEKEEPELYEEIDDIEEEENNTENENTENDAEEGLYYSIDENIANQEDNIENNQSDIDPSFTAEPNKDNSSSERSDRGIEKIENSNTKVPETIPVQSRQSKKFGIGFLIGFISAAVIFCAVFLIFFFIERNHNIFQDKTASNTTVNKETNNDTVVSVVNEVDLTTGLEETQIEETVDDIKENDRNKVMSEEKEKPEVPTEVSDEKKYDTITKTRYLTTMAKDHYGNYHLWPYIYMENQKMLGHPDRIKPGTKVVIPSLSKYGVNPNNKSDIEKAKKKGVEIYSRYK